MSPENLKTICYLATVRYFSSTMIIEWDKSRTGKILNLYSVKVFMCNRKKHWFFDSAIEDDGLSVFFENLGESSAKAEKNWLKKQLKE